MSRQLAQVVGIVVLLTGLCGCGFTPLYATGGVTAGLSQIKVEAPDGRTAYLLRERLDDSLALNRAVTPRYRLAYTLVERRDPRGLGPDNAASRYELTVQMDYVLTEIATGARITAGVETVLISYDAVDAPYAGISAQQDSQERAAAELARRLRINLAQVFAGRQPAP
jgi:LPS-assembly lipoprotein